MNKILSKLLVTTLVAAIVLSAMPAIMTTHAVTPPLAPYFYTDPDHVGTWTLGSKFSVIVYAGIAAGENAFTWQVNVTFDPTLLSAFTAKYTAGAHSAWLNAHGPTSPAAVINNALGYVVAGETLLAPDFEPGPSSGSVLNITFTVIQVPGIGGNLTCNIDPAPHPKGTYILDPSLNTIPGMSYAHAVYANAYQTPTSTPFLEMFNYTENTFGMFTHWIPGPTTMVESIYVNIDAGWFLNNIAVEWDYNASLLQVNSVAFDPLWTGSNAWSTFPIGGYTNALVLVADAPSSTPSGMTLIANVTLTILTQGDVPPEPYGYFDSSARTLKEVNATSLYALTIPAFGPQQGELRPIVVFAFLHAIPPYLSVSSIAQIGPGPSIGQLFNISISLNGVVEGSQHLIGVQYRLAYNSTLIQPVAVSEGPYFPFWASQEPGSMGTFFVDFIVDPDGIYGPHVIVGNMVFPNASGQWNENLPDGSGVIDIITFKVLAAAQSYGEPENCVNLTIVDQKAIGLDNLVSQNLVEVFMQPPVNGSVCFCTNWPGRNIDLYGGAVNSGLIKLDTQHIPQFVPPYGGQGPNVPMDLVEPQSWVYLNANVTYNYWPVQHKLVAFEVDYPSGAPYTKLFAFTDDFGVAMTGFRMPWPCVDPENLFGSDPESAFWNVTATVELADVIINDTMQFHYDYIAHIFKATTDAFQYNHGGCVGVTFSYGSLAAQTYPAEFLVRVVDNLGVTIGWQIVQTTVGNAWANNNTEAYKNFTAYVNVPIPKWAYAGIANVYIDAFNMEPAEGGVAITPEFGPIPIAIQPY